MGLEHLPRTGGVIVAGNHVSYWDPVLIGCGLDRPVYFMAKSEFFDNPVTAALFRGLHAFPVRRGMADRHAIRRAMELLNAGEVVGIFPEGTRNQSGETMKAQLGVAMIAVKTGCPVLPAASVGGRTQFIRSWFNPRELRLGAPLSMEPYRGQKVNSQTLDNISADIMERINELL